MDENDELPLGVEDPRLIEMVPLPDHLSTAQETFDHLTVRETIYHYRQGRNPTAIEVVFFKKLKTKGQPYPRERTIGEEWEPLADKSCWIEKPSMVVIENREGIFPTVNPTDEERQTASEKIIEYGFKDCIGCFTVQPASTERFCPSSFENLMIRCRKGEAEIVITILPE